MTKKFWKDWQNRIGETKSIYGWYENSKGRVVGGSLVGYLPFRIISAKFNKNTVDLVLEEISLNVITHRHHVENRYVTLHRNEIATVKFIKY